jgi:hypothetical protein
VTAGQLITEDFQLVDQLIGLLLWKDHKHH